MKYESKSLEDTMAFAESLAKEAKPGDILCLCGPLGAGKTAFAKGFAKGLGIQGHVSSPTFTIMQVYDKGRLTLYHFDLYRLMDVEMNVEMDLDALDDIGFSEYLESDGVCLVEWAEYAEEVIPDGAKWIRIETVADRSEDDGSNSEERTIHIC